MSKRTFDNVLLDKNRLTIDTHRLAKQHHRLPGMMKHVNNHDDVKATVVIRYCFSIEQFHRDRGIFSQLNVNTLNRDVRALVSDQASEPPISTADVQHRGISRNKFRT